MIAILSRLQNNKATNLYWTILFQTKLMFITMHVIRIPFQIYPISCNSNSMEILFWLYCNCSQVVTKFAHIMTAIGCYGMRKNCCDLMSQQNVVSIEFDRPMKNCRRMGPNVINKLVLSIFRKTCVKYELFSARETKTSMAWMVGN